MGPNDFGNIAIGFDWGNKLGEDPRGIANDRAGYGSQ